MVIRIGGGYPSPPCKLIDLPDEELQGTRVDLSGPPSVIGERIAGLADSGDKIHCRLKTGAHYFEFIFDRVEGRYICGKERGQKYPLAELAELGITKASDSIESEGDETVGKSIKETNQELSGAAELKRGEKIVFTAHTSANISKLENNVTPGATVEVKYKGGNTKLLTYLGVLGQIILLENANGKSCNAHVTAIRSVTIML